jgi:MFS family permease
MTDRFGPGPVLTFGAVVIGIAFAGLGLTAGLHSAWFAVLPLMFVFGFGLIFVAGPVSTSVMTSVADRDTGTASAINNAVARVAGLFAVAMMGALAAWVFAQAGSLPAGTSFGLAPPQPLPADAEAARVAATDRAFAIVAYVTAGLAALSAVIAWTTQAHKGKAASKTGDKAKAGACPAHLGGFQAAQRARTFIWLETNGALSHVPARRPVHRRRLSRRRYRAPHRRRPRRGRPGAQRLHLAVRPRGHVGGRTRRRG